MQGEEKTTEQLLKELENLRQRVATLEAKEAGYQQLEETLRQRESEIRALLGVAPHPVIARFDRDLRHTYVSAAVRLATGIPPEAYIGKTSREMGTPEPVVTTLETALRKVFAAGAADTIEYSIDTPTRKWVFQSYIVPELYSGGAVESVLAITRDISQQREAEAAVYEHMEILETVRDLGQELIAELDLQKLVQTITDAATELSGAEFGSFFYNVLDEKGESYTLYILSGVPREAFSNFPMPRNTHLFGPTFRGEGTVRIDDVHQDPRYGKNDPYYGMPEGHLPVTSYLAVPVVSRSKEVLGGLFFGHSKPGIFTESDEHIIEGLAAQAAIAMDNARLYREARDQQERLRITLAGIGDAVIATDTQGRITFMNGVAQALTAWTEQDAIGKPLKDVFCIVNEFTRKPAENPVSKVLREGRIVGLANHTTLLARDGREIPIDDSGAPIFDDAHNLVGVILVFRDITERRQSEQRINLLLELSAAFSQALTSHQIAEIVVEQARKALGAVIGTVALLVEDATMLEILNLSGLPQETIEKYRRTPLSLSAPLNDAVRSGAPVWIESFDDYVSKYPHFAEAIKQNGSQSTVCLPLTVNEKIIGGFSLSFPVEKPHDDDEEAFFIALAQQCAQSLERARLNEQTQAVATLEERQRLARDLHDAVSQVLFSSTSLAETVLRMWERDPAKAFEHVKQVVTLNRAAMAEMRSLLLELRPETIIRTDLRQLIEELLKAVKGRRIIETELVVEGQEYTLPSEVHIAFYRIAQEAINNIVKHSQAAEARVDLHYQPDRITLQISDNGIGFDIQQVSGGLGQTSMRERAKATGASITIDSHPGKGTTVALAWTPTPESNVE
jgi:PAS domain S-box-containing protein